LQDKVGQEALPAHQPGFHTPNRPPSDCCRAFGRRQCNDASRGASADGLAYARPV